MIPEKIAAHFVKQATGCERLGSPFTASLCRLLPTLLDETTATGRKVLRWPTDPGSDALALRLCGGLHALVLDNTDPDLAGAYPPARASLPELTGAVSNALARNDARLSAFLESPPQTNESARSAMLLPGFLAIAREVGLPLALREIGSSAGLNLLFDRFSYRYGNAGWGDAASAVHIAPETSGAEPDLSGNLRIASRTGSDIAPIDIANPAQRSRLRTYVWADQSARLQRLDAAMEVATTIAVLPQRADAANFTRTVLGLRREGECLVLFHSIMWQYLPGPTRDSITESMMSAGAAATTASPLAWLRMEPLSMSDAFATLQLTLWPDGRTRDLARCDFHGRSIEWLEPGG